MTEEELNHIIKEVDIQGSGIIHYHEFIAATFPVEKYATKERLESLFQKFDADDNHAITSNNLRTAFTKLGHNMTDQEVDEILAEHDINHDHDITFDEFKALILDHMWA